MLGSAFLLLSQEPAEQWAEDQETVVSQNHPVVPGERMENPDSAETGQ